MVMQRVQWGGLNMLRQTTNRHADTEVMYYVRYDFCGKESCVWAFTANRGFTLLCRTKSSPTILHTALHM